MHRAGKIAAVVVTCNRLALLRECLDSIRNQKHVPDVVFVVNNGSADGTFEFLSNISWVQVINQENGGGAGGFFSGMKAAYEWGADAVWCMDDDTVAFPETLQGLVFSFNSYYLKPRTKPLGWVGSVDLWTDGRMHVMNRPCLESGCDWLPDCRELQAVPATANSYVSILISREALTVAGYPLLEMYIWGDDVEHTTRICDAGFAGLVSFLSPCLHRTLANSSTNLSNLSRENLKKYSYFFRNTLFLKLRRGRSSFFDCIFHFFSIFLSLLRKRKFFALPVFFASALQSLSFKPDIRKP